MHIQVYFWAEDNTHCTYVKCQHNQIKFDLCDFPSLNIANLTSKDSVTQAPLMFSCIMGQGEVFTELVYKLVSVGWLD